MLIPDRLLLACGPFGERLNAQAAAAAIARGLHKAGLAEPDVLLSDQGERAGAEVRALLDAVGFDARMRASRAVLVACAKLREDTLAGSAAFEIATRARQAGVPAYAITAENRLNSFDARILDLQVILEASSARTLSSAAEKLAALL